MAYKLGDKVTLKRGLHMGMGRLKRDVVGIVAGEEKSDKGETFYRVRWVDSKTHRERIAYVYEDEIKTGKTRGFDD